MLRRITKSIFAKFMAIFLALNILIATSVSASNPIVIPAGSTVILETTSTIQSDLFAVGDTYDFRVRHDLVIDDKIVIAEGTIATGQITRIDESNYFGAPGSIELEVVEVKAVDGQMIPLTSGIITEEGKNKQTESLLLGILICFLFLLIEGEPAQIETGTLINASTASTLTVNVD